MPLAVDLARRDASAGVAYATDLSTSGMRLQVAAPLAVGDVVELRVALPGEASPIAARARVSWCEDPPPAARASLFEAGVRFERLAEPDRERVAQFVRSCQPARLGPG